MLDKGEAYTACQRYVEGYKFYFLGKFHIGEDIFYDAFQDSFLYAFNKYNPNYNLEKKNELSSLVYRKMHLRIPELKHVEYRQGVKYLAYSPDSPCLTCNDQDTCTALKKKDCKEIKAYRHAAHGFAQVTKLMNSSKGVLSALESSRIFEHLIYRIIKKNPDLTQIAVELYSAILFQKKPTKVLTTAVTTICGARGCSRATGFRKLKKCIAELKSLF